MEPDFPLQFAPDAQNELESAALWYARHGESAAARFLDAVERALQLIREFPLAWPRTVLSDARRITVSRTPYSLVYRVEPSRIVILAVSHGKRKPDYWQHQA